MNLTGITAPFDVATLHFLDSLFLQKYVNFSGKNILDLGSGAGFPGIPLAIANPDCSVTLLDAQEKRILFLTEAAILCNLPNVTAIHGRAEELGQSPIYREQYDIVTSRAVASLPMLCELALPLLKPGGVFLAMKSTDSQEEVDAAGRAISLLGGQLLPHVDYDIPDTNVTHRVIRIEKIAATLAKYPRRFAKIQKAPL